MSDSDSEKYDGLELWHDVVSILIHPPMCVLHLIVRCLLPLLPVLPLLV